MASSEIYNGILGDGREISVVEWTVGRRICREVQIFVPAPPGTDPATHNDRCVYFGPPQYGIEEIIRVLPALALPPDVVTAVTARLRGGARAPLTGTAT